MHSGPNFQGEGDIMKCSCYDDVRLLEHGLGKVVERVLENSLHGIVTVNEMQFGFMCER